MMVKKSEEIILRGLSAAPGICIGKAYLVDKEGVDVVPKYRVPQSLVAKEVKRFKAAVKKSRDELRAVIENTPDEFGDHAAILETQEVLLKDKMLYGRTVTAIETEHVNAEWALKKTVAKVKSVFGGMTDDYLKERVTDIVHLSDRIMGNLVGAKHVDIAQIDKRVILVAADLTPAETSQIRLERIKGFVTDRGGKASHTGIIARSLEIPAVLGLGTATTAIKNDDVIIVDGNTGTVIVQPSEKTLIEYEDRRSRYESHKAAISRGSRLPAETLDGHHFEIMGNIELPEKSSRC
jgi:phosphotransferase system enzyme I (PtsI)